MNFISRNNFNNNAYRGNFNPRHFPSNSSNNYVILLIIIIGTPLILRIILNNFSILKRFFNATIEEKLNKIDDMSRSIDRISQDVETLKMKFFVPKVEESIKALYVSMEKVRKEPLYLELKQSVF